MAFENKLLTKLFEGVLSNRQITIRDDMTPAEDISGALELLPLPLSTCQRDAVTHAWRSDILLRSRAAGHREVAHDHRDHAHGRSSWQTCVDGFSQAARRRGCAKEAGRAVWGGQRDLSRPLTEQRKKTRGQIQKWIEGVGTFDALPRLAAKRRSRDTHEQELRRLLRVVRKMEGELKAALEHERDYFRANEAFLRRRREFERDYPTSDKPRLVVADRVRQPDVFKSHLERASPNSAGGAERCRWLFAPQRMASASPPFLRDRQ